MLTEANAITVSIAPWLSVVNGEAAVLFYTASFGAVETYRLHPPEAGFVVRLSVNGAEFWVSEGVPDDATGMPMGGNTVRMILTVPNPEKYMAAAVANGATEIFPLGEDYGWKLGRIADPFGLHWEIGHPL